MKKISIFLNGLILLLSLTGCSNASENEPSDNSSPSSTSVTQTKHSSVSAAPEQSSKTSEITETSSSEQPVQSSESSAAPPTIDTPSQPAGSSQPETQSSHQKEGSEYMMNIKIGENILTATLEHNSSADALLKLLSDGPITIHMSDYAGMEKVGTLPTSLPRNDKHIDTNACDLILYQGNSFVIYYDTNSWSLTRLGKINNMTQSELKKILGNGDVTAVLSLPSGT